MFKRLWQQLKWEFWNHVEGDEFLQRLFCSYWYVSYVMLANPPNLNLIFSIDRIRGKQFRVEDAYTRLTAKYGQVHITGYAQMAYGEARAMTARIAKATNEGTNPVAKVLEEVEAQTRRGGIHQVPSKQDLQE